MTPADIERVIATNAPKDAKAYRLVQERNGAFHYTPPKDAPALNLHPFEVGAVLPGTYGVLYVDGGKEFVPTNLPTVLVESLFPAADSTASLAREAAEVGHSLELEKLNADTLNVRATSQAYSDNIAFYSAFQRALGLQNATGLRVENERIEQLAKASRTLLETQAAMLEMGRQLAEKNRTPPPPPPPPNWEKIVSAGAPALAAMYTATLAAITKTAPVKVSGLAEPLAPESEKLKKIYEALGNVSSNERLDAMLKDDTKLADWVKLLRSLLQSEEAADRESNDPE